MSVFKRFSRYPLAGKVRILLVDESMEDLHALIAILREHHFSLAIARDGKQGYQRAIAMQPDLILLDAHAPVVDGFATCRLLKSNTQTRNIPVIFLTAAAAPEERLRGLTLGAVDYVVKPFYPEEVLMRIRIHLHLANPARPHESAHHAAPQLQAPLHQALQHQAPPRAPVVTERADEVTLRAAMHFISSHLDQTLSLAGIARNVGSHEKRLSKIFRELVGLTVFAFIREERNRVSRKLLSETDMSIQAIAEQVGFQNAGNFTTAFRERFGVTPTGFRQSLKKTTDAES